VANDDPVVVPVPQTNLINYPNPFRTSTTISFRTDAAGVYRLQIYNMRGQMFKARVLKLMPLSELSWTWDCTDMQGSKLASGLYFAKLGWPGGSYSRKLLLLD
jgi:flagellar hook assembly protein FlgD